MTAPAVILWAGTHDFVGWNPGHASLRALGGQLL